ncbi:ABC transporter [Mesorhizobium sp. M4B.F.Ca.ET.214.01.1.1]|nr:ABC transporter [Mesorhizobium sp. M4B.F.Ca.ET.214.01.1.1]TGQ60650.1 ABC transporter [Mesorhizobium sp. M4B.F.Ca.ET.211.01.1.1]TGU36517.1 ABC transporter [Mesorhizobium sp. M4B.F.Ca.ET.150.01.1.1]
MSALPAVAAGVPESKDPLKLVMMGYSGDNIIMFIYGKLLQKLGYTVEWTPADYLGQFAGIETGDLTIGSPGWDTTAKAALKEAFATGKVLNMGDMGIPVHEDWWYPLYVKDVCPGLPDWTALKNPDCIKALSTAETDPKARFLSGPVEWGGHDQERIDALGLNFEIIHAGSDAALTAEFTAAIKRKQPIIGWTWEPYWLPAQYEGEFVKWPEYTDACYDEKRFDCARPSGRMWKTAWAGGESKWPKAYEVLRKFQLDTKTMGALVARSDVDGIGPEKAAEEWLAQNESVWKPWLQ